LTLDPSSAPEPPAPLLPNCYWALPGQLLAGEHPSGSSPEETRTRIARLLAAGIECFIDLTFPGEAPPYDMTLPIGVEYLRKPIKDHGIPEMREHMREILDCVRDALRSGRKVYVHCRAGIGRTGTVVGCLLVEQGLSGEAALEELNRVWQQSLRSRSWDWIPETPAQGTYVRNWLPARPAAAETTVPIAEETDPLLEDSTLSAARGVRSRFLGALLGLAAGDALAAATQYRRPGTFTPVGDLLGGGPFDLPRGGWSDDTAMALCLADSLLERDGFDARDQVERYRRWQKEGYLSATGQCVGITASTARALALAQWRRQLFSGSHDPTQLDPEPLSRVGVAVMFFFASPEEAIRQATESARPTCQAPAVLEACRLFAAVMLAALSGQTKAEILAQAATAQAEPPPSPGSAPEVLDAALWAFATTTDLRGALLRAVNLGGNSDVVGAVCGQLAGAHYTVAAIPLAWRNALMHKDLIESLADRLLARALLSLGG
jgi:ADP-ribosyl-[dinitrogen reductase] hydrolase